MSAPVSADNLVVGNKYVNHDSRGHQTDPRTFLGISENGYVQFVGPLEGQIMSMSADVWTFYVPEAAPIPNVVPDGWVELAGGFAPMDQHSNAHHGAPPLED